MCRIVYVQAELNGYYRLDRLSILQYLGVIINNEKYNIIERMMDDAVEEDLVSPKPHLL